MKRYFILTMLMAAACNVQAQNRQHIAGFSQFRQYLNPALTGYAGTAVQGFYRDQMNDFDDASKTVFFSGEAKLPDLTGKPAGNIAHSFGLAVQYEGFGASRDIGANLSYSAAVKIAPGLQLSAGVAATYNNVQTETSDITVADESDPAYLALLNDNVLNKYGANIGVALTAKDFYAGYALCDAFKHGSGNASYYNSRYIIQHAAQAGYRYAFSNAFGLVANAVYRYDAHQKGVAEGQLKTVFRNTFWAGAGYRQDIAYTFNAGIRIKQLKLEYYRELYTHQTDGLHRGGNEAVLSYNFTPVFKKAKKALDIW
ncbi:MAG: PorP/SprF family type IX secretion system membrane protein [Niabella sp.]